MNKTDSLIESKTLRDSVINRTEVLDKVKKLSLLPDDVNASVEIAADYYEVAKKAIDSLILDHREELESDGLKVIRGKELISLKEMGVISKNTSSFTIIPRRAMLRIGMLLKISGVARMVREYLLNVEEISRKESPEVIDKAMELQIKKQRAEAMLLNAKARAVNTIMKTIGDKRLSPVAIQMFGISTIEEVTGQKIDYRPEVEKTYTAEELAEELGVTPNKIGRVANANGLKTEEYGYFALDKSKYSSKQVESFRYNEKGRQRLRELLDK